MTDELSNFIKELVVYRSGSVIFLKNSDYLNFKCLDSNFVLGNAVAPPDYPIVYCSDGFCALTGELFKDEVLLSTRLTLRLAC